MSDAKKAPVENMAKVMEIFEAFIAAKKVIQCKAITMPAKKKFKMLLVILVFCIPGTLKQLE